jgi:CxxC motif-containing protein/type IV pilus biogenesis protein CpaD/CtpE
MADSLSVAFASNQSALPLSSGAATSAKQDTQTTLLTAMSNALAGILTINLPAGAATSAKQDSQITILNAINNALGGTLTFGLPTDAATATKQDNQTSLLTTVSNALAGTLTVGLPAGSATGAKQDSQTTLLTSMSNALAGTLTIGGSVSIGSALPAGTNAIGKLAANDAVDIGDVTINNAAGSGVYIRPGTSAVFDIAAASLPLPAGAATSAKQDSQTTLLTTMSNALAGTLTIGLPADAATGTKQDSQTTLLTSMSNALAGTLSISGSVSIGSALPAGTNAIGKLAANDAVDIGDVTINNAAGSGVYIRPGTSAVFDIAAASLPLPAGAATSAKQDSQTTLLTSMSNALAGTLTIGLPTGSATSAKQDNQTTLLTSMSNALAGTLTIGGTVSIGSALPAGTNAIGKLAANDAVDIGDVTINNAAGSGVYIRPGTGTNLDTNNVIVTSISLPTGPVSGQATIGTAAAAIGSSTALKSGVNVLSDPDNAGKVYIGPSGVSSSNGYLLQAGFDKFIETDNIADVYAISDTAGQKIYYLGS